MRGIRSALPVIAGLALAACGGGSGTAPTPTIGAAVSGAITLVQGQAGTAMVTITRSGGFSGAVDLATSGVPAGVTATFDPIAIPAGTGSGTSTLTLTAATNAATGSVSYTVTASGAGVSAATATGAVTVTPASVTSVSWKFCDLDNLPLHFSFQDGNGVWTAVTGSAAADGRTYSFHVGSGTGGVAFVEGSLTINGFAVREYHGTGAELQAFADHECVAHPNLPRTINVSTAGSGPTDWAFMLFGRAIGVFPGAGSATTVRMPDGPADLIAVRVSATPPPLVVFTPISLIIRRGLDVPNGGTVPVVDFATAEAFAPISAHVTVTNMDSDQGLTEVSYQTAGATGTLYFATAGPGSVHTVYGVPAARQAVTDLHVLSTTGVDLSATRTHVVWAKALTDMTVTLGPALVAPTFTLLGTTPYPRYQATGPIQASYDDSFELRETQSSIVIGGSRMWTITAGRGYFSGANYVLAFPDLSTSAGWQNLWAPSAGASMSVGMTASGYSNNGTLPPNFEGGVAERASRVVPVTP